jgi:hypothetical protein
MPTPGYVPPHWLRENAKVWSPDSFIVFDTETSWLTEEKREVHVPRCWALDYVTRHLDGSPTTSHERYESTDISELAPTIDALAFRHGETWCFAHNLGFDLAVSALPERLAQLSWDVADFWLGDESTWVIMKLGKRKLVLTDSFSWLRMRVEDMAKTMRRRKPGLPANAGSKAAWLARCADDADILQSALCTLMDWWDREELGKWGITGSACGWAAARHKMPPKSILVGPDEARSAFERRAIYGGRREAWYVGHVATAGASDYDFVGAYPTVVANLPIPRKPLGHFDHLPPGSAALTASTIGVIAECTITTDIPCAPVRIGGEVWWPVGTFRTVLASPEIRLALDLGATVEVGAGYSYSLAKPLAGWAGWCLATQHDRSGKTPQLAKMMAKGWGRSVIGRFAQRNSKELLRRPATRFGWHLEHGMDNESGASLDIVTMGGEERWLLRDQEGRETFPAIFAWVESCCRSALTKAVLGRPSGRVLQCDTDGWLERERPTKRPAPLPDVPKPFVIKRKGRYEHVRVQAATQLWLDGERRTAGVGRSALELRTDCYSWWDWPTLRWQLQHGDPGTFTRTKREAVIHGDSCKRWVLADGSTLPVRVRAGVDGQARPLGFLSTYLFDQGPGLAPAQHPALRGLEDK